MVKEVLVDRLPICDYCFNNGKSQAAIYDGKTDLGYWANMCESHFEAYGMGLGKGKGQKLKVENG